MECILVFDIGTTSLKTVIFDCHGKELGSVSRRYPTSYPGAGMAEQQPEDFWNAAVDGVRDLTARDVLEGKRLEVIGLTGHMNGCLLVDSEGIPVYPELIHADSRSTDQCRRLLEVIPHREIYRRTGNRVDEHLSLPKLLWIRDHQEDAYNRTAWFLNSKDYLRFKLTGILGESDYSDASLTGALDITAKRWDRELITEVGLSPDIFPSLVKSTDITGTLSREAALILGLPEGVPVSGGGGDAACSTRGAGVTTSRQAYGSIGSSAWISTLAEHPVYDDQMRMQNFYDIDGEHCNICGTVQNAGAAVDWVLGLFYPGEGRSNDEYRAIEDSLRRIPPGSKGVLFLPYLMGERTPHWDAAARGAFVGLSLLHSRETMVRAVYEGVAFALRDIMDVYQDLSMDLDSFTLLGGGVRSEVWRSIISTVVGIPMALHRIPTHAASLGAALGAGVGAGIWSSLDEAASLPLTGEVIEPDREQQADYDRIHLIYRDLYGHLKPAFESLAQVRAAGEQTKRSS